MKLSAVYEPHVDFVGRGGLKKRDNLFEQTAVYGVIGRLTGCDGGVARFDVF